MNSMELHASSGSTKVVFGDSREFLSSITGRTEMILVVDDNITRIHGGKMNGFPRIVLEAGESAKTLKTVEGIYHELMDKDVDKSSLIVGIGGGTVSDITGFAASTFKRGIPFGFVPTTLLAQVDASIGGKNGVNFNGYKNMIGVVRQPDFCVIDFSFLKTLPLEQLVSGMAEIVKCGAILDPDLFLLVEENYGEIISLDAGRLEQAVSRTVSSKMKVVGEDEMDGGERMKLNFGHTVGHAIEKVASLPHGHSISIGMAAESWLAVQKGILPSNEARRIEKLLKDIGLPTRYKMNIDEVLDAISKDKKGSGDSINIALPHCIGSGSIHKVRKEEFKDAVKRVCA